MTLKIQKHILPASPFILEPTKGIFFMLLKVTQIKYSSVPNRHVGQNKRAGGKILRKH